MQVCWIVYKEVPMYKEYIKENYIITTNPNKIDINSIKVFLSKSYWASSRTIEQIKEAAANSLNFMIYQDDIPVGYARVVTDCVTFAYLCDVFIDEPFRNKGLGKWLMECISSYPSLQNLRRWLLVTQNAHGLYSQFGFQDLKNPEKYMEKFLQQ